MDELTSSLATNLVPYAALGGVAVVWVWALYRALVRRRKAKQAVADLRVVDETISRADALDLFWELGMLPNAQAGEGMFKEHYVRDMLSTIRRMRALLLPMRDQAQDGAPLDATQRGQLRHLRKEFNRCMERPDGQYFDVAATLAELNPTSNKLAGQASVRYQSRAPRYRPAAASFAETRGNAGTNTSNDEDWFDPLNPFSPLSPLNPLSSFSPWHIGQSEPRHQDDGERSYGGWRDSGTRESSTGIFCGSGDSSREDVSRRSIWACTSSDDGGGGSGGSDSNDSPDSDTDSSGGSGGSDD